jgi:Spy/CpxP family protein refolding chaperone
MKYTKETQEIASQLWDIIQREVDDQFEEKLENLKYALEELIRDAKETRDDYDHQGLTFSRIEAEGYLRAMLTIESLLKNY